MKLIDYFNLLARLCLARYRRRFAEFTLRVRMLNLKQSQEKARACFRNLLYKTAKMEEETIRFKRSCRPNPIYPCLDIPNALGNVQISMQAKKQLMAVDISRALARHRNGDWGDISPQKWRMNNQVLIRGDRHIFSCYHGYNNMIFGVLTSSEHSKTQIFMEEEFVSCQP